MDNQIIITGAGSGIGRALAISLSQRNIPILAVGRRLDMIQETASLAQKGLVECSPLDIGQPSQREQLSKIVNGRSLAGLVHCAGIFPIHSLADTTLENWQQAFAVNVEARLFLSQAFAQNLGSDGRVLFIGSMSATTPRKGTSSYCASKAASFMLQECLKKEFEDTGPAVSSAIPGPVKSHILDIGMAADPSVFPDGLDYKNSPQIDPERVGRFLAWLLLDTSRADYSAAQWDIRNQAHHSNWLGQDDLFILS